MHAKSEGGRTYPAFDMLKDISIEWDLMIQHFFELEITRNCDKSFKIWQLDLDKMKRVAGRERVQKSLQAVDYAENITE